MNHDTDDCEFLVEEVTHLREILKEYMEIIETVGVKKTGKEWPDLLLTYNKARCYFSKQAA